jgi:hypothetical protein
VGVAYHRRTYKEADGERSAQQRWRAAGRMRRDSEAGEIWQLGRYRGGGVRETHLVSIGSGRGRRQRQQGYRRSQSRRATSAWLLHWGQIRHHPALATVTPLGCPTGAPSCRINPTSHCCWGLALASTTFLPPLASPSHSKDNDRGAMAGSS